MIDLILIILLIASLVKPDILLAKKVKEKASEEQKLIVSRNLRKIYAIVVASFESIAISRYTSTIGMVLLMICIVLFFVISIPAIKENSKILKELK